VGAFSPRCGVCARAGRWSRRHRLARASRSSTAAQRCSVGLARATARSTRSSGWTGTCAVWVCCMVRSIQYRAPRTERAAASLINGSACDAAVVVGVGSLRVVFSPDPAILDDRFFGYSDESQLFIAIALGYFVWDIVACIRHSWGAGFILHGASSRPSEFLFLWPSCAWLGTTLMCMGGADAAAVACLITYFVCSYPRPFVHYCACFFLLYELSTPFMHIRQFCIALKKTDTVVFKLANALFPLVFFAVRLVAGITFSYDWAYRQWEFVNTHPERDTAAIAVCCYLYVAVRARISKNRLPFDSLCSLSRA
jgi:hypothetical protein